MKGWISLNRSITDNWLWSEKPFSKAQAWIDLIIHANHKSIKTNIKGRLITVERGQQARSEVTLAKSWGWSRDKVRRFLMLLSGDEMIIQQKNNVTSIITICNYSNFQDAHTADKTLDNTTEKQQTLQLPNSRQYTNNNGNNEDKKKKPKKAHQIKEDWVPDEKLVSFIVDKHSVTKDSILNEVYSFVNHWIGNGQTKKDWNATFRTWCARDFCPIHKFKTLVNGELREGWEFAIKFYRDNERWPNDPKYQYARKISECPENLRAENADLFSPMN